MPPACRACDSGTVVASRATRDPWRLVATVVDAVGPVQAAWAPGFPSRLGGRARQAWVIHSHRAGSFARRPAEPSLLSHRMAASRSRIARSSS